MVEEVTSGGSIRAVSRVVSILELFQENQELTMSEVARATGLSESTVFRYLGALTGLGWLVAEQSGSYRLGIRVFQLGQSAVANLDIGRVSLPYMEALLGEYGETVNCAIYQSDAVVVIKSLESASAIRRGASVGQQDYLFSSALGKAIASCLPIEEVFRLQAQTEMKQLTERSITSLDELLEDLRRIRARGYSLDDEESELGLMCVAAASHDSLGFPRYALSVSGPTDRIRLAIERGLGETVARAAAGLSRELGNFTVTSLHV
ncbi:MAG TPA: IclR family transcriptional regulator [Acidimicrobiales bacterium]|nr:IclR family transcriptional regulator [Acidimicrobiales bacterium]